MVTGAMVTGAMVRGAMAATGVMAATGMAGDVAGDVAGVLAGGGAPGCGPTTTGAPGATRITEGTILIIMEDILTRRIMVTVTVPIITID